MKFQKFLIFHLWVCVTDLPRWREEGGGGDYEDWEMWVSVSN